MLLTAVFTTILYSHSPTNLHGPWILDDRATVKENPVVLDHATIPWSEVWKRDFWGHDDLTMARSHKSWRPLCTASYRLQRMYADRGGAEGKDTDPYWFHVVDRILHGIVTALILPVAGYTLRLLSTDEYTTSGRYGGEWRRKCRALWVTALFAVHPIHVEAVANSTGRAEVLCALFYLLGFWVYARLGVGLSLGSTSLAGNHQSALMSVVGVVAMMICSLASMLCKEHGVTLPIMCIVWDAYIGTVTSVPELVELVWSRNSSPNSTKRNKGSSDPLQTKNNRQQAKSDVRQTQCKIFLLRTIISILLTLLLATWRLFKNGTTSAHLVCEQNPAACEPDPLLRLVHFSYLWCLNFWILLCPTWLSPDWSGESVPLIGYPATDVRVPVVFFGVFVLGVVVYHAFVGAVTPLPFSRSSETESSSTSKKASNKKSGKVVDERFEDETKLVPFHLWRRTAVTCFIWMLLPFIMSSNLLVYVGFVIADRTLYLPSFGFCLLLVEGLVSLPYYLYQFSERASINNNDRSKLEDSPKGASCSLYTTHKSNASILPWICASIILVLYTAKQQAQTKRWSDSVLIWEEAYRINPDSCINGSQFGMALVNAKRNKDGAKILMKSHKQEMADKRYVKNIEDASGSRQGQDRPSGETKVEASLSNLMLTRFKLVTAMGNSGDCANARLLIEEGLKLIDNAVQNIERQMQELGYDPKTKDSDRVAELYSFQKTKGSLINTKAYLLVSKSRCATDIPSMGQFAHDAVLAQPGNEYTKSHAQEISNMLENIRKAGIEPKNIQLSWEMSADGQNAKLNFEMEVNNSVS